MLRSMISARRIGIAAMALSLVATAFAAHRGIREQDATAWREAAWPFPLDNWGQGRAWHTTGPNGSGVLLFARTKSGFCNCFNGIADDAEIDRIGDVDLHGQAFTASAPGEVTSIGVLPGRERAFQITDRWRDQRHVLSIVAASDCKAVVATLVSDDPIAAALQTSAVAVLIGDSFRQWAANQQ